MLGADEANLFTPARVYDIATPMKETGWLIGTALWL